MSDTEANTEMVIVDDELQNVLWMADYFEAQGFSFLFASNVNEAIEIIEKERYRVLVIDLNIPVLEPYAKAVSNLGATYIRFPGLFVAKRARTLGYRSRQVIIYSVHKDAEVIEEAAKLRCTYIAKGRPREIKAELEAILSFDPEAGVE